LIFCPYTNEDPDIACPLFERNVSSRTGPQNRKHRWQIGWAHLRQPLRWVTVILISLFTDALLDRVIAEKRIYKALTLN